MTNQPSGCFNPSGCLNPKPGIYRHYKGNRYELIDIAKHSETLEPMAVYRALYGDNGLWVRPLDMFTETVVVDGETVPRFAFVETTL